MSSPDRPKPLPPLRWLWDELAGILSFDQYTALRQRFEAHQADYARFMRERRNRIYRTRLRNELDGATRRGDTEQIARLKRQIAHASGSEAV